MLMEVVQDINGKGLDVASVLMLCGYLIWGRDVISHNVVKRRM